MIYLRRESLKKSVGEGEGKGGRGGWKEPGN